MIGSRDAVRTNPFACIPVRVTSRANAKPIKVVDAPTNTPINSEFQATPQLRSLLKQSRPQILCEMIFSRNKEKT